MATFQPSRGVLGLPKEVFTRVSVEDHAALKHAAKAVKVTMSALARQMILHCLKEMKE